MKRLPPILVPFWAVIYAIDFSVKWLLGFWECRNCHKTYWVKDDRYKVGVVKEKLFRGKIYYKNMTICLCKKCYKRHREQQEGEELTE